MNRTPPDAALLSILVLAGAQMRTLLDALASDPTISRECQREAAEAASLWDKTAAMLGRPKRELSPVVVLLTDADMLGEPASATAPPIAAEPPKAAAGTGAIVLSPPPAKLIGSRGRKITPAVWAERIATVQAALQDGPRGISALQTLCGMYYETMHQTLKRGPFRRLENGQWDLLERDSEAA